MYFTGLLYTFTFLRSNISRSMSWILAEVLLSLIMSSRRQK